MRSGSLSLAADRLAVLLPLAESPGADTPHAALAAIYTRTEIEIMGTRTQELQASMEIIWDYADHACQPGSDLRSDIEFGKPLLKAAPALLEACEMALGRIDEDEDGDAKWVADTIRAAIALAKGE